MLTIVLTLLTALLIGLMIRDIRNVRSVPVVRPVDGADHPDVSVIVPARDEAHRIGPLLDGLARQTSSAFELIVLDDHSVDGTATLVAARSNDLPRLRVIQGQPLPPGWAGKCWACWQAAGQSSSGWLLFLDADTAPTPAFVASAMHRAQSRNLDLLTLFPFLELASFWERLLMPAFAGMLQAVFPFRRVNDPASPLAMANGQCILIRRDVYLATGGHQAVRASVLEDVHLGRLVKGAGYRIEVAAAPELLKVRMYTSFAEISEGLRKNAWAGYQAGGWRSSWAGVRQALLAFMPPILVGAGILAALLGHPAATTLAGFGGAQWLMTAAYWGWSVRWLGRLSPLWGLLVPLGILCYFVLAGVAGLHIRRGRGVQWKGRAYRG